MRATRALRALHAMRAMPWRDVAVALRAAWGAPAAIEHRLPALLALEPAAPGGMATGAPAPDARRVDDTLRATRRALALLARMPRSRWRTTCLYRSAAECLALRALGMPVRVVIGVNSAAMSDLPAAGTAGIRAHAWVAGASDEGSGYAVLTGPALARGDAGR